MKAFTVNDLRACQLCSTSALRDGELWCTNSHVCGVQGSVPCETARFAPGGGCGRDATHMAWSRLEVPVRRVAPTFWAAAA